MGCARSVLGGCGGGSPAGACPRTRFRGRRLQLGAGMTIGGGMTWGEGMTFSVQAQRELVRHITDIGESQICYRSVTDLLPELHGFATASL